MPNRSKAINLNESKKILYDIGYGKITYEETLKIIENIRSDIKKSLICRVLTQTRLMC